MITQAQQALENSDRTKGFKDSELCWVNKYLTPNNQFEEAPTFEKALTYPELRDDPAFSRLAEFYRLFPSDFLYPEILKEIRKVAGSIVKRTIGEEEYNSIINSKHEIFQKMRRWLDIVIPEWKENSSRPICSFMRATA